MFELLEWETAFWGWPVGRVAGRLGAEGASRFPAWCLESEVRCVFWLVGADDRPNMIRAHALGFEMVDVRLTFGMMCGLSEIQAPYIEGLDIHVASNQIPDALLALAERAHTHTRFYRDGRFPRAKCGELYRTRLNKGVHAENGIVLLAYLNGRPAGYLSCAIQGAVGRIDMNAVEEGSRQQGVGRSLVKQAHDWLIRHDCREIITFTQGNNISAQRFYERLGFTTRGVALWYHWWKDAGLPEV